MFCSAAFLFLYLATIEWKIIPSVIYEEAFKQKQHVHVNQLNIITFFLFWTHDDDTCGLFLTLWFIFASPCFIMKV